MRSFNLWNIGGSLGAIPGYNGNMPFAIKDFQVWVNKKPEKNYD